jgi:hypothetical protein
MCYPKSDEVKRAVNEALRRFYLNDRYLIDHNVNERSLTFRLGFYLQQIFSGWDVDCEFNRNCVIGNDPKRVHDWRNGDRSMKNISPDIIIHRRGTDSNLLVIEAKKENSAKKDKIDDTAKVEACIEEETLCYRYGLFLDFKSSLKDTLDSYVFYPNNLQKHSEQNPSAE